MQDSCNIAIFQSYINRLTDPSKHDQHHPKWLFFLNFIIASQLTVSKSKQFLTIFKSKILDCTFFGNIQNKFSCADGCYFFSKLYLILNALSVIKIPSKKLRLLVQNQCLTDNSKFKISLPIRLQKVLRFLHLWRSRTLLTYVISLGSKIF